MEHHVCVNAHVYTCKQRGQYWVPSSIIVLIIIVLHVYLFYRVWVHVCHRVHVEGRGNLRELALFFHPWVPGIKVRSWDKSENTVTI